MTFRRNRVAALFLLALAGCSRPPAPLQNITLASWQGAFAPALAETLGIYQEELLAVRVEEFPGISKGMEALVAGSADFALGTFEQALQMAAEGRDVTAVLVLNKYHGLVLAASPAARKRLATIPDLKGATVGVPSLGGSGNLFVSYLLGRQGIAADGYQAVPIGTAASSVAALESGKVDAGILMGSAVTALRSRHPGLTILSDTTTTQGVRAAFGVDTYPSLALLARKSWLQQHDAAARHFVRAVQRTQVWMRTHTAEEILDKLPERYRMTDRQADLEAIRLLQPMLSEDGRMAPKAANAVRSVLAQSNPKIADKRFNPAGAWTNQYVP